MRIGWVLSVFCSPCLCLRSSAALQPARHEIVLCFCVLPFQRPNCIYIMRPRTSYLFEFLVSVAIAQEAHFSFYNLDQAVCHTCWRARHELSCGHGTHQRGPRRRGLR